MEGDETEREASSHHEGLGCQAKAFSGNKEPWQLFGEAGLLEQPCTWPGWREGWS